VTNPIPPTAPGSTALGLILWELDKVLRFRQCLQCHRQCLIRGCQALGCFKSLQLGEDLQQAALFLHLRYPGLLGHSTTCITTPHKTEIRTWGIESAVLEAQHQLGVAAHEVVHHVAGRGVVAAVQEGGELQGGWGSGELHAADVAHAAQLPVALPEVCQARRVQRPYGLGQIPVRCTLLGVFFVVVGGYLSSMLDKSPADIMWHPTKAGLLDL